MFKRTLPALWIGVASALGCTLLPATACAASAETQSSSTIDVTVDAQATGTAFPHFWEEMFGGGHSTLALRASYQRDLAMVNRVPGVSSCNACR